MIQLVKETCGKYSNIPTICCNAQVILDIAKYWPEMYNSKFNPNIEGITEAISFCRLLDVLDGTTNHFRLHITDLNNYLSLCSIANFRDYINAGFDLITVERTIPFDPEKDLDTAIQIDCILRMPATTTVVNQLKSLSSKQISQYQLRLDDSLDSDNYVIIPITKCDLSDFVCNRTSVEVK